MFKILSRKIFIKNLGRFCKTLQVQYHVSPKKSKIGALGGGERLNVLLVLWKRCSLLLLVCSQFIQCSTSFLLENTKCR